MHDFSRREFLKTSSVSLLSLAIPESTLRLFSKKTPLKIGLISDLHVDIIHDGQERMAVFLNAMKKEKPDALIQMGDFAIPKPENSAVIQAFNDSNSRAFHVLGNHDMDGGYSKEDVVKAYGMRDRYYSIPLEAIQLIILDGNDAGSPSGRGGYPSYIGPDQQAWLTSELERAIGPVLIVCHQPIAGVYPIDNTQQIQEILSRFASKILLVVNGHAHVDQYIVVGGVNYLHINSASYYWVGEKWAHESLTQEIHEKYPELKYTCPYSACLFALLIIDPKTGELTVKGRKAEWIGPSPLELGYTILSENDQKKYLNPVISSRKIS